MHHLSQAVGTFAGSEYLLDATAILQMSKIGGEIISIAEQDLSLIEIISKITVHNFEQSIVLERAFRFNQDMAEDDHAAELFKQNAESFKTVSSPVEAELEVSDALTEIAVEDAPGEMERQEFEQIQAALKNIRVAHASFDQHAFAVLDLLATGCREKALAQGEREEPAAEFAPEKVDVAAILIRP